MEKALLLSHATAGLITLLSGIVAMMSPKKLKLHRPMGIIFYYTMWYVVLSAFSLALLKSNVFLFLVGTLTFYTNVMGYRCLKKYQASKPTTSFIDWFTWGLTIALLVASQYLVVKQYGFRFDGAFLIINVFTLILLANLFQDLKMLLKVLPKKSYLIAHIGKMGGTFIAAITAALVQNVTTDPVWIAWLLPAVLVSPIIAYFTRSVRRGDFWKNKASKMY